MDIPNEIDLMGQTIKIVYDDQLVFNHDVSGQALYRQNIIKIQPSSDAFPRTRDQIETTYLHEIIHWILHIMQEEKDDDEKFVQTFALLLHQAMKSARITGG